MENLRQCKNPLVIEFLVICAVSLLVGDVRSATVVGCMIVLTIVLAHVQEHRSQQGVEKLDAMVEPTCLVLRDGKEFGVQMAEIVPGDIVVLRAGAIVPANLRLISAKDFFVSQLSCHR
jgi:P-type Mg2+ transporter